MIKLTWRDVFDGYKLFGVIRTIDQMPEFLKTTHYMYFSWNNRIYQVDEDYTLWVDTHLTIEDLEK